MSDLIIALSGFMLLMLVIYQISIWFWPNEKKTWWEILEEEERS